MNNSEHCTIYSPLSPRGSNHERRHVQYKTDVPTAIELSGIKLGMLSITFNPYGESWYVHAGFEIFRDYPYFDFNSCLLEGRDRQVISALREIALVEISRQTGRLQPL